MKSKEIVVRVLRCDFEKALKMGKSKISAARACPISQAVRRTTGTHKSVIIGMRSAYIGGKTFTLKNASEVIGAFDKRKQYHHAYVRLIPVA